ncbi:MAG: hypothetical protein ACTSRP_16990 [Candidatus Helarchaeota archaeon]
MDHFLIKIFKDKIDEDVHNKFLRYSKGEFEGPKLNLVIKGKKINFYVDRDYDEYFLDFIIKKMKDDEYKISGNILTPSDPSAEMAEMGLNTSIKKKKGIYEIKINDSMNLNELQDAYKKLNKLGYPLLSISPITRGNPWKITTKKTIPRPSGKSKDPEKEEERPNFCKGTLPKEETLLKQIIDECLLDYKDQAKELENLSFKELILENKFIINEIILPDPKIKAELVKKQKELNELNKQYKTGTLNTSEKRELKKKINDLTNYIDKESKKLRLSTKRKGIIKRVLKLDETKVYKNEFPFEA